MSEKKIKGQLGRPKVLTSNETLRRAEAASSIGAFEFNLTSKHWVWTPQVAVLFGLDLQSAPSQFNEWLAAVFPDDALKISSALETSMSSGSFYVEFRVRWPDDKLHWLAGKGQVDLDTGTDAKVLRGTYYDINERKQLEARLLSVNETLEARVAELREEAHTLEVLNRTGIAIGAELDLERLIQIVTDAGVELSGAQFGAFFYNVNREDGEAYTLYTLSGAPREAFAKFPMPRKTQNFEPTFRGTGTACSRFESPITERWVRCGPFRTCEPVTTENPRGSSATWIRQSAKSTSRCAISASEAQPAS